MKKLLAIMLSLVMVSTLALAKPTTQLGFATMSKADSQFLFKDGAKAVALDKAEMKETEGKFWPIVAYGARIAYSAYRSYRAYKSYRRVRNAYRMGRSAWRATSRYEINKYKRIGGRGVTWYNRSRKRTFTIDSHKWTGQRSWYQRFHYHRRPGIKKHRPWQRGW